MKLNGRRIILGITGSISAYKSALLTRLLVKEGAEVQIIMSASALSFITPLTLSTLSKRPVNQEFFNEKTGEWTNHVDLGLWAELMIIAPASANSIAKFANGICDNLLTATYLSAKCPVMIAPAMDLDMYQHPSTQNNLSILKGYGNRVLETEEGELASGLYGKGRLQEPEHLLQHILEFFENKQVFTGKKILITSGPTQEAIDPVRFISNHSSGKMGSSIAEAFANAGAKVYFITGPSAVVPTHPNIEIIPVTTADQMFIETQKLHQESQVCVFTAAVADYKPAISSSEKIKKSENHLQLDLIKNKDIAASLGKEKTHQIHIGFALETQNEEENALNKLQKKNFDLLILNSMKDEGAGFKYDTNQVTLFFKNGQHQKTPLLKKKELAEIIVQHCQELIHPID
jgi:phosphopantothenoylcysteine decarboxylase / phosphopantothenate---cysteine ligase